MHHEQYQLLISNVDEVSNLVKLYCLIGKLCFKVSGFGPTTYMRAYVRESSIITFPSSKVTIYVFDYYNAANYIFGQASLTRCKKIRTRRIFRVRSVPCL